MAFIRKKLWIFERKCWVALRKPKQDLLQNLPSENSLYAREGPPPPRVHSAPSLPFRSWPTGLPGPKKLTRLQNAPSAGRLFQYGKPLALCGSVNGGRIICHNWALAVVPIFEMPLLWALLKVFRKKPKKII